MLVIWKTMVGLKLLVLSWEHKNKHLNLNVKKVIIEMEFGIRVLWKNEMGFLLCDG